MHHLDDIRERGILPNRGLHDLPVRGLGQPLLDEALRPRAKRLPPNRARPHDLHEVAQHLAVIDHAAERGSELLRLKGRKQRDQQGRHILHVAALAGVNRRLRDEGCVHLAGRVQHLVKLCLGARIEGAAHGSRHGKLRQSVARLERIGWRPCTVARICLRNRLAARCKQRLVRHVGLLLSGATASGLLQRCVSCSPYCEQRANSGRRPKKSNKTLFPRHYFLNAKFLPGLLLPNLRSIHIVLYNSG